MAGRRGELSLTDRLQVGRAVAAARKMRVPWKVLERVYDRNRSQLWRYAREANDMSGARCNTLDEDATSWPLNESRTLMNSYG